MSSEKDTKFPTTASAGPGDVEKATEINRESHVSDIDHKPKHIANNDPDEALKLVAAQYALSRYLASHFWPNFYVV